MKAIIRITTPTAWTTAACDVPAVRHALAGIALVCFTGARWSRSSDAKREPKTPMIRARQRMATRRDEEVTITSSFRCALDAVPENEAGRFTN